MSKKWILLIIILCLCSWTLARCCGHGVDYQGQKFMLPLVHLSVSNLSNYFKPPWSLMCLLQDISCIFACIFDASPSTLSHLSTVWESDRFQNTGVYKASHALVHELFFDVSESACPGPQCSWGVQSACNNHIATPIPSPLGQLFG